MFLRMKDNVNLYVREAGEGPYCIFIHGGPGSWSKDFEVLCGSYLEQTMKMVYFDQRGCGRSEGDSNSDYSIDRMVQDIEEIRRKLNIEKWVVLAHSFGGIIAANYVSKYEKYVQGLILANCTLNMEDSLESQIDYGLKLLNEEKKQFNESESTMKRWEKIFTKLIEKHIFYKLQYNEYSNYLKVNEISSDIENTSMAKQAFHNEEYFMSCYHITKDITIPVLIIAGNKDYAIGCEHYKKFMFPNAEVKIIEGKHLLYIENREEFIDTIKKFIDGGN